MDYIAAKSLLKTQGFEDDTADGLIGWLTSSDGRIIALYKNGRAVHLWSTGSEFVMEDTENKP